MRKLLIILFVTFNYSIGQVVLDSVAVTVDFKGPFNKTVLEMYVLNTSEKDNVEFFINFKINKNSIVENLWLETDNKLKRDITLSRVAGSTIYRRILRRRIDPTYLIKYDNCSYHLRIFPINKNQRRKVVIEYYSILGGKEERFRSRAGRRNRKNESIATTDTNSLYWFINFQKEPNFKSLKLTSTQPNRTILDLSQIDSTQSSTSESHGETFIQNYASNNVNDYSILFNYKKTNSITKYNNDSLECFGTNKPIKSTINFYKNLQEIDQYKLSPPDFVKYLILHPNEFEDKTLYLNKTRYECNSFLEDMLYFISDYKSNEIKIKLRNFTNQNDFSIWYYDDSTLVTEKLSFSLKSPNESVSQNYVEIECPYVNKFFEYTKILYSNLSEQISSRYLTESLSKIVIENDSVSKSIKNEVLESERIGTLPQFEKTEPVFFIAVEKMPEIVGGLDSVYTHLFFPVIADSTLKTETIFIKVTVNQVGEIICKKILRSNNEILSNIGSLALSIVDWLPGEQRGKPVSVQVSIPLIFNKDTLSTSSKKFYEIDNRNYIATVKSNHLIILQEGFNFIAVENILYRTKNFYEFLINNPEYINIVYKVMYLSDIKKLGLVIKTKGLSKNVLLINPE